MGPSEKTQHAIRRSTRLPLEVPVLVTSLNASASFSEQCNTTLVNAHGCGLIVPRVLAHGIQVRLEIVSARRHTTAQPARSRRWRLPDISAGACYLETAAPFPADTPVLLSIRALDTECLLEGVVRVSHAQMGMGVEFTRAQAHDQRARVEELIDRLTSNREVPRIFVGRKEDRKEDRKEGQPAAPSPAPDAAQDGASPGPPPELGCPGGR